MRSSEVLSRQQHECIIFKGIRLLKCISWFIVQWSPLELLALICLIRLTFLTQNVWFISRNVTYTLKIQYFIITQYGKLLLWKKCKDILFINCGWSWRRGWATSCTSKFQVLEKKLRQLDQNIFFLPSYSVQILPDQDGCWSGKQILIWKVPFLVYKFTQIQFWLQLPPAGARYLVSVVCGSARIFFYISLWIGSFGAKKVFVFGGILL